MFRLKLFRNIRTAIWLLLLALIPLTLITIYWANSTGLPDKWRDAIETEISKHGFHVKLDSLKYIPLRGFVANGVRVYAEEERINEISRFERVGIVIDYTSLASGQPRIRKVELRNARLSLPVDPKNPSGDSLSFTEINGIIFMPNERLMELRNTRAKVGGIDITLSASLLGRGTGRPPKVDDKYEGRRRELIANIIRELERWDFDSASPPHIIIDIEGELTKQESIKANFSIVAPSIERRQYKVENFKAEGNLTGNLLTIPFFSAKDQRGDVTGSIDYHLLSRDGKFDVESSIDIQRLLKSWLQTSLNLDLLSGGRQNFQVAGDYDLTDFKKPIVNLTGHARCESIMFRGVSFDSVDTFFSYQNGNLFLRNLKIERPDGTAEGKIMKEGNIVRLQLNSSLPSATFKPFFIGQPLEQILEDFKAGKDATCNMFLEGSFDIKDRFAWSYIGNGEVRNSSYRGVPVNSANCSFVVNHHELDFFDGTVTFNYTDYPLRKAFKGPSSATAKFGRARYDAASKTVGIEAVTGDFWAAPLVRMFAPEIADNLEQYRFHKPPSLSGSGVIDVTPEGRTNLTVNFKTNDKANYKFLGEDITLSQPKAVVKITGSGVRISDLSAKVFSGDISGEFTHRNNAGLSGEVSWSKLALPEMSSTYDFKLDGGGEVTGRLEFTLKNDDVSTMDGTGLIALENGELFAVPIFGPLSGVVSTVLVNKNVGFERANHAFCNFTIKKGILNTRDFQTSTTSVVFTGDGSVDLAEQTIDFTIRLNARGLLGLLTLPFKPFYGLFQFRGTGPLKKTTWENVHFTSPPPEQDAILLSDPPKAEIVPE